VGDALGGGLGAAGGVSVPRMGSPATSVGSGVLVSNPGGVDQDSRPAVSRATLTAMSIAEKSRSKTAPRIVIGGRS
jgi:hypothetical protein